MDRPEHSSKVRRYTAYLSPFDIMQLEFHNPYIIAFWSFVFPGLGHLMLCKCLRCYLLFCWEIFVNSKAHINLAILYSFTGRFEMAKDILDLNWVLFYIPTYIYAIWDSYRTTVDLNHQYMLEAREDAEIKIFNIGLFEINYLDKRIPWNSAVFSALMPGLGQALNNRLTSAVFIIVWFIVIATQSRLLPAIHYTLLGQFNTAKLILNPQWFLNIPSIYFAAINDAYTKSVHLNKLFDWEQSKFLKKHYENKDFKMPLNKAVRSGEGMYIISTFDHSNYLELAITAMQMKGITKENILAVSMKKKGAKRQLFDTIHYSDGLNMLDLPIILATIFSLAGGIYGFMLTWGPILWGIIGMAVGLCSGLIIKLITIKKYNWQNKQKPAEVVLIIECKEYQLEMTENLLWEHNALGVRILNLNN